MECHVIYIVCDSWDWLFFIQPNALEVQFNKGSNNLYLLLLSSKVPVMNLSVYVTIHLLKNILIDYTFWLYELLLLCRYSFVSVR